MKLWNELTFEFESTVAGLPSNFCFLAPGNSVLRLHSLIALLEILRYKSRRFHLTAFLLRLAPCQDTENHREMPFFAIEPITNCLATLSKYWAFVTTAAFPDVWFSWNWEQRKLTIKQSDRKGDKQWLRWKNSMHAIERLCYETKIVFDNLSVKLPLFNSKSFTEDWRPWMNYWWSFFSGIGCL